MRNSTFLIISLNLALVVATKKTLLPVFVWLFGGGFQFGGISTYTPEYIMDEDVIFVTIQYRVGIFGFLSTNDEVMPGNQALKDVRLGLRWVQDNIRCFGGDPERVTLSGHSAGGTLVHALMLFSAHEGLFRAGITMSACALSPILFQPAQEVAKVIPELARLSSCPSHSAGLVECLKQKPAEEIVKLNENIQSTRLSAIMSSGIFPLFRLVVEPQCVRDRIITDSPWSRSVTIPWLAGVNKLEGAYFLYYLALDRSDILFSLADAYFGIVLYHYINYINSNTDCQGVTEAVRFFYLDNRPINRGAFSELAQISSDVAVMYPTYEGILRGDPGRTYVYVNEYVGDYDAATSGAPPGYYIEADHGAGVSFFFPHSGNIVPPRDQSVRDDMISKRVVRLWIDFATDLKPTSRDNEVNWQSFGCEERFLNITENRFHMDRGFFPERMRFWQNTPYVYRDEIIGSLQCCEKDLNVFHRDITNMRRSFP